MGQAAQFLFNTFISALVVAGQVYVNCALWPRLEKAVGRGRATAAARWGLAVLQAGTLVVVWLNSEGYMWGPSTPLSRAVSFAAAIWVSGCAGTAFILGTVALLKRRPADFRSGLAAPAGAPLDPGTTRREFLSSASRATAAVAPLGAAGYATLLVRSNFELRESAFPAPGLPSALEGLRIALLTDIHFGPYLSLPELDRVIEMTNETRPHLVLITGDLITRVGDPVETCLSRLSRLRPEAGLYGCLGNHEIYARCQDFTEKRGRSLGIDFLRQRNRVLEFGGARLNLVGVDYQRKKEPYLAGAERLIEPRAVNLLLSHNPDVFPVAADLGYDLVVGGHTHGGQVTVEILEQTLNVGRFFTPFVSGLYRRGASSLYVSRGIGTINLPMRLGARPEVSLLQLRRV